MKYLQLISTGRPLGSLLNLGLGSLQNIFRKPLADVLDESFVYVRENRTRNAKAFIKKKAAVTVLVPTSLISKNVFTLKKDDIVFEDGDIVVIDKPSGISTQPTQTPGQDHLFGAVIAYYTEKNPGKLAYIGLHHRLDRDTSGLLLFAKKSSMNKAISDQFQNHKIKKKYQAIVSGEKPAKEKWTVDAPIARLHHLKNKFMFGIDKKKGDRALTHFRYIKSLQDDRHVIECEPVTGRTHQLRIHLAYSKLPIIGDAVYGKASDERMLLHASTLEFAHPRTGTTMVVKSNRNLIL